MTSPKKIGVRIRKTREKLGLSMRGVAKTLGRDPQAVAWWEKGRNAPNSDTLPKLADALGVTPEWLLTGTAPPPPDYMPGIPFHPLANLFPLMTNAEIEEMAADMVANGFRSGEEIVVLDGQILDGRNRARAAICAGLIAADVNPTTSWLFAEFGGSDIDGIFAADEIAAGPLAFVISRNLRRRHMSASQRAMAAAKIADLPPWRPAKPDVNGNKKQEAGSAAGATGNQKQEAGSTRGVEAGTADRESKKADRETIRPPIGGLSTAEAAATLNVGKRSVERARTVIKTAEPEVADAVTQGDLSVALAEDIATLPPERQREIIKSANPKVLKSVIAEERKAKVAAKKLKRAANEKALAGKIAALPDQKFGVIYADPEWEHETWSDGGNLKAAANHYPVSSADAIRARFRDEVPRIAAPDCALFLWSTVPHLPLALEVMALAGFEYKSQAVWAKDYPGKRQGTGYWLRVNHEILLIGARGRIPCPAPGENQGSVLFAPPGAHSVKPVAMAEMIEGYYPNVPKIELNARAARAGWTCVIHDPDVGSKVVGP